MELQAISVRFADCPVSDWTFLPKMRSWLPELRYSLPGNDLNLPCFQEKFPYHDSRFIGPYFLPAELLNFRAHGLLDSVIERVRSLFRIHFPHFSSIFRLFCILSPITGRVMLLRHRMCSCTRRCDAFLLYIVLHGCAATTPCILSRNKSSGRGENRRILSPTTENWCLVWF